MIDHLYKEKQVSAVEALFEAQKIAFGPVVFQTVITLRDLGVLTYIRSKRKSGATAQELSEKFSISLYGIKTLLEMAASAQVVIFKENEEDTYLITKIGMMLNSDEMTRVNMNFINDVCYKGFFHLTDAIRNGKPEGLKEYGDWKTVYEGLSQLKPKEQTSWFEFDHFYSDGAFPDALPIVFRDKPKTLFDVGGNTGKWAGKCYEFDPNVQITILDLPGQLNKAKANLEEKGYTDRINFFEIDLLSDLPAFPHKADAIWMSQFLDCFSESEIVKILQTASKAMHQDSIIYVMETFWDNQKFEAATYSLHATSLYFTTIANGNSKMYHSGDFTKLVEQAGLVVAERIEPVGDYHTILKCKLA